MRREERVTVQGPVKKTRTRRNVTQGGRGTFSSSKTILGHFHKPSAFSTPLTCSKACLPRPPQSADGLIQLPLAGVKWMGSWAGVPCCAFMLCTPLSQSFVPHVHAGKWQVPTASSGIRLSSSSLCVRFATAVICGVIVGLDSSEP